jgi:hypothetical protein
MAATNTASSRASAIQASTPMTCIQVSNGRNVAVPCTSPSTAARRARCPRQSRASQAIAGIARGHTSYGGNARVASSPLAAAPSTRADHGHGARMPDAAVLTVCDASRTGRVSTATVSLPRNIIGHGKGPAPPFGPTGPGRLPVLRAVVYWAVGPFPCLTPAVPDSLSVVPCDGGGRTWHPDGACALRRPWPEAVDGVAEGGCSAAVSCGGPLNLCRPVPRCQPSVHLRRRAKPQVGRAVLGPAFIQVFQGIRRVQADTPGRYRPFGLCAWLRWWMPLMARPRCPLP